MVVPGGVDRSGEHRVIPCLLWLIERLAAVAEVHVFALHQEQRPSEYRLLGAVVHNIGGRARRARAVAAVVREHMRSPFDVLHAIWVDQGLVAAAAGRLLRRGLVLHVTGGDLAAVSDIHYGLVLTRRGRIKLAAAARLAARITVPSEFMRRAAEKLGIVATRLPLGVALDRWPPVPPKTRPAHEKARLLHVASLNRVKDQPTLLRAVRWLLQKGIALHLDVVGIDTLGGEIQRLALEWGLERHVTFHGFLPHRALRHLAERADLLLMSSRHEADPVVLLEAAVVGVPTVGTAVGHISDWSPEAAVAVPVGDWQALARETAAMLGDEVRRLRVAHAAQRHALCEDADWTAKRVLDLYEDLAGRRAVHV